jgi:dTDP-4-dehydrorhamnose reductase
MLVNGRGAGIVAEACREVGAAIVYVSSNEVFDGEKGAPYDEDDATNAVNAYAASKLEGERQVTAALEARYIVRTSWLYGPGRVSFPEKILQAARRDGKLRAVTDEIASPTWTVDLAEAIAKLVRQPAYGVYHLTNAGWCSRLSGSGDPAAGGNDRRAGRAGDDGRVRPAVPEAAVHGDSEQQRRAAGDHAAAVAGGVGGPFPASGRSYPRSTRSAC